MPADCWTIITEGASSAAEQMALDDLLARQGGLTARCFTWRRPAISRGFKQSVPDWVSASSSAYELIERPTGGGIAFHGSDVSLAVVIPRALGLPLDRLMHAIGESAGRLCQVYGVDAQSSDEPSPNDPPHQTVWCGGGRITYCLAEPSPYAVFAAGRKLAGFAIRRYPESWLIQGSLLVRPIPQALRRALPAEAQGRLEARSASLAEAAGRELNEPDVARQWSDQWIEWWEASLMEAVERR